VVEFDANPRQLYAANVWLRTASRVVVRVATFRATDFVHLQDHASRIDWARWVPTGFAPSFRVTATESKLFHTKAIAQRLHQVSLPPSLGEPEQRFVVRIHRNTVTISADASGEPLYRRPWRTDTSKAPLRPNLAAALVLASAWSKPDHGTDGETGGPSGPLIDPFCGSGTIGIEAALLARGYPPGGQREFAFQHWPTFEPGSWASVAASIASSAEEAAVRVGSDLETPLVIMADRDQGAVARAEANAARAGVSDDVVIQAQAVSHLAPVTGPGAVVTNPPYGKRVGGEDLANLYGRFGSVVRDRLPDFGVTLITSEAKLAAAADRRLKVTHRFRNGGLGVQIFQR
jgi:putative N6-adenine-specific DNA methylase